MSFALVLQGMNMVAFAVILAGGRAKRENGWKMLSLLLAINGIPPFIPTFVFLFLFLVEIWC